MNTKIKTLNFIDNTLFNESYLASNFTKIFDSVEKNILNQKFEKIREIYTQEKDKFANESDLEQKFILPILSDILGFYFTAQKTYLSGEIRPDYSLFSDSENITETPLLVCENKAIDKKLNSGNLEIDKNPHLQVLNYISKLDLNYSFLTNGKKWRIYHKSGDFYEIDLISILENGNIEDFNYFYFIFKKSNFLESENFNISSILHESKEFSKKVEEDLKQLIYGINSYDSIFEKIGQNIYKSNGNLNLDDVFEKSLYFTFRILFVLFFEDRNRQLLENHKGYLKNSLNQIYLRHREKRDNFDVDFSMIYPELMELFQHLRVGSIPFKIPVFNGGLFEFDEILDSDSLFKDSEIFEILNNLIIFGDEAENLKRDFNTLSVINLGSIYEGLLDYRFRKVEESNLFYVERYENKSKKNIISEYLDDFDFYEIDENLTIKFKEYKIGELYLSNSNNSRKESASYYTPKSISSFMVEKAIDEALEKKSPFELKIIDNACGSGHFLVESLNYLTKKSIEVFNSYSENKKSEFQHLIEDEKNLIYTNLEKYKITGIEISDLQVLKRILLKKAIFGVDLNMFAVEISKLALWIDTFIFGTPLSLIQHHIKHGNSLIGSNIDEVVTFFNQNKKHLFLTDLGEKFKTLKNISQKLSNIVDTTEERLIESKKLFAEIKPQTDELNQILNFYTLIKIKNVEKKKDFLNDSDEALEKLENPNSDISLEVAQYLQKFRFFNYQIEFPEVEHGFDVVVGNPPWDKVKFDEKYFFPKYEAKYRQLKNSEKSKIAKKLLENGEIKSDYENTKYNFEVSNKYLSEYFPKNRGAGDNNLFRFFVEKNLSLLSEKANLTYVLPSALFQDDGSIQLRKDIFQNFTVNFVFSFENRLPIFVDVHSRYKFAVIQILNEKAHQNRAIKAFFYATDPADLKRKTKQINYKLSDVKEIAPHHLNLLELRDKQDLEILKKSYKKFNALDLNYFDFRRELDSTNDKSIFHEERKENFISLFEGKMIHQFDSNFAEPNYFLDPIEFDKYLESKERHRLISDIYEQLELTPKQQKQSKEALVLEFLFPKEFEKVKFAKLKKDEKEKKKALLNQFLRFDREFFKLAYRKIASDTNERTVVMTILNKNVGYVDSLYGEIPKKYILKDSKVEILENSIYKKLFLLSVFNSLTFDFLARQIIQINVNKTYLTRLPLPQPTDSEIIENPVYLELVQNSFKILLFQNSDEVANFSEIAKNIPELENLQKPKNEKEFINLKLKNDLLILKLYDISKPELKHILSTFKVLNKKQPKYVNLLENRFN